MSLTTQEKLLRFAYNICPCMLADFQTKSNRWHGGEWISKGCYNLFKILLLMQFLR